MNGNTPSDACAEPQIQRMIRDAVDNRERAENIQQRLEGMLERLRGGQPSAPKEIATAGNPHQPGAFGELESTLARTQGRLNDMQSLVGELENYI